MKGFVCSQTFEGSIAIKQPTLARAERVAILSKSERSGIGGCNFDSRNSVNPRIQKTTGRVAVAKSAVKRTRIRLITLTKVIRGSR
jgi:hypothetical protein